MDSQNYSEKVPPESAELPPHPGRKPLGIILAVGIPVLILLVANLVGPRFGFGDGGLPACDSAEVIELVEKIIRETSVGETLIETKGHQETSFDAAAQVRRGRCIAHTQNGAMDVLYQVEWQNRLRGKFYVQILPNGLPDCDHPAVIPVLKRTVRRRLGEGGLNEYQEDRYDADADVRICSCLLETNDGSSSIRYSVSWENEQQKNFLVSVIPPSIPAVNDPEVVKLLGQIVRKTVDEEVVSIDRYREVRYEEEQDRRYGRCDVRLNDRTIKLNYLVEWGDQTVGYFLVRILPEELPACDSREVIAVLEQIVRSSPRGNAATRIDDYQQIESSEDGTVRLGRCTASLPTGDVELQYRVEWRDRERGEFQVVVVQERPLD